MNLLYSYGKLSLLLVAAAADTEAAPAPDVSSQLQQIQVTFFVSIFQGNNSGTTAVCTLIHGQTLYNAWLGDSQSILVRNGRAVKIVEPHKPNRPVSYIVFQHFFGLNKCTKL